MGLRVTIYKDKGQTWSNGGVSERVDQLTLVNVEGPSEPTEDAPAAMLLPNAMRTVRVIPALRVNDGWVPLGATGDKTVGPMAGGAYVASSDSRFSEAVEKLLGHTFYGAVALHDRYETPEQYRTLSV